MVSLASCGMLLQALLLSGLGWTVQAGPGGPGAPGPAGEESAASPPGKAAAQEDARPQEPQEFRLFPDRESLPVVDFRWLESQPRLGLGFFTEDFDIDPSPYFSVMARAPMPWISPGSDPVGDYFGVFAEATFFPQTERGIEPELENPSGSFLFFSMGFDFTLVRDQSFLLAVHGGALYGWYGGVTNLDDGLAGLVGLTSGVHLGKGVTLTLGPEAVFARAGDRIYLGSVGLLVEF